MIKNLFNFVVGVIVLNQMPEQIYSGETIGTIHVAIGSLNHIKVQSVKNALGPQDILTPCSAESKVRPQPLSNEETLEGAINRAKDCLEKTEAELAIGLEAGIHFLNDQTYLCHWGAIIDRAGNVYFTNGLLILLPDNYKNALLSGDTLEHLMHQSTGIEDLGKKEGAIGIFTENLLNREHVLTQMVKVLIGQYRHYQK